MSTSLSKPITKPEFVKIYQQLLVAFREKPDAARLRAELEVYFGVLTGLPEIAVRESAMRLARAGGEWFPKAPGWHEEALRWLQEQRDQEGPPVYERQPETPESLAAWEKFKAEFQKILARHRMPVAQLRRSRVQATEAEGESV